MKKEADDSLLATLNRSGKDPDAKPVYTAATQRRGRKIFSWLWRILAITSLLIIVGSVAWAFSDTGPLDKAARAQPLVAEGYATLEAADGSYYLNQEGRRYYLTERHYYGLLETMPEELQRYIVVAYLPEIRQTVEAQIYDAADKAKLVASFAEVSNMLNGYKAALYEYYPFSSGNWWKWALLVGTLLVVNGLFFFLYRRERKRLKV
jgi:hypothetical protein